MDQGPRDFKLAENTPSTITRGERLQALSLEEPQDDREGKFALCKTELKKPK